MKGSLYNHPRLVWLILLLIVVSGLNSFATMPRLEDPHIESRVVQVTTRYPGADAERVEAEITEKLESKIREITEVKEVTSTSRAGLSFIRVELEDRVKDAKPITARLRDKIAEVTDLPTGASEPDLDDTQIYAHSAIIALTWHAESEINYAILGRHANELASKLRNLSGTDYVDILGLPQEEIRISVDDALIASHGLTMSDVAQALRGSDASNAAGLVSGGDNDFVVEVAGAFDSLARIRRVPLRFDEAGASLRIGDVARVERSFQDPPTALAYLSGDYGVAIAARMYENSRIDAWSDDVGALLAETKATLPTSLKLERIFDQRTYTDERLNGLMANLAEGAFVVLAVLLVSLGYRAAIISASILPLTLLATLAMTHVMGLRIEQVLVTGMIVALGIMVDNAIVITDEIQHLRLKGERRSVAVAKTIKKLWLPLLGSTVTTIIAFMPLLLMPGNAGDFMIGVPAAVISALIASYVIAFTIISAVAGRVVEGRKPASAAQPQAETTPPLPTPAQASAHSNAHDFKRVWWRDGIEGGLLARLFRRSLEVSIRYPLRSIVLATLIPVSGLMLADDLTEQFFPISDRNQFRVQIFMPSQASISETRRTVEEVHSYIETLPSVESAHWFVGTRPAKFFYAIVGNNDGVVSIAEGVVTTKEFDTIPAMIPRLQAELDRRLPQARVLVRELITGPPIGAPLEVKIIGPDLAVLEEIGDHVRSIVSREPFVISTNTTLSAGRPQISVIPREDDVSVTGLSLAQVEEQLRALTTGIIATHVVEATEQVPVRVIASRSERSDLTSIVNMSLLGTNTARLADNSFQDLPLSAVADVELRSKVGSITRLNTERMNLVQAYLEFGILPGDAFKRLEATLADADIVIPAGYRLEFGGENEKRDQTVTKLFGTAGMLVVLMLIAIVLTFNSFRLAFVTFAAAVQAAGLGIFSLWVFDYPLSFVVLIGLAGLIGLAINAAIVILSELRGIEAARKGDTAAVVDGVMATGRHILSTTLTTVGGFTPLILAGGYFWPPFAVAIAGGALLSMIVSFYFAPAAFVWLTRLRPFGAPGEDSAAAQAALAKSEAASKAAPKAAPHAHT